VVSQTNCYWIKEPRVVSHIDLHHHHPLIPLSGVGTKLLLPFSSITRHLHTHSFYSHVILHTVHPSFLRSTSSRVPISSLFALCDFHLSAYRPCLFKFEPVQKLLSPRDVSWSSSRFKGRLSNTPWGLFVTTP
jgi:hypothetical protein